MTAATNPANWPVGISVQLNAWDAGRVDIEGYRNAGVSRIELAWSNDTFDMYDVSNQLKCEGWIEQIRSLGMDVWTLHLPYGPLFDPSEVGVSTAAAIIVRHVRLMELAQQWGIRTVVLHPSFEPIGDSEREERIAACKRALSMLADEAERLGVVIAVECLPRTCLGNTSGEIREIVSADERLGICCDVNHLVQEPPEQFIRELGSRIVTVHMSDNDGVDERHWMPGRGVIRWGEVIQALSEQQYNGPFMFEVRNAVPTELEACWNQLSSGGIQRC